MGNYIITPKLGGLANHDQRKTSNLINYKHRHTNR